MKIIHREVCGSTMDFAAGLALNGSPGWTAVISEKQTSGRGRNGRRWLSPSGGIYASVILRPRIKVSHAALIGLLASAVIAEFLRKEFGIAAATKWPNDVLVDGKKIAGILCEAGVFGSRTRWIILGMGLNLNAVPGLPHACSVSGLTGRTFDVKTISEKMLKYIRLKYEKLSMSPRKTIDYWIKYSSTLFRYVTVNDVSCKISGQAVGIDFSGALVVKTKSGSLQRIYAGDCIYKSKRRV